MQFETESDGEKLSNTATLKIGKGKLRLDSC